MLISRAFAEELVAHARQEFPNECCGMLAGEGGRVVGVHRATNTESSPFMYVMDPREQLDIMDAIDAEGHDLLAVYHSHTRSAAYPSRTDVELAFFPQTLYVIVSIADADDPDIRAFRIRRPGGEGDEGEITEEPVEVVD